MSDWIEWNGGECPFQLGNEYVDIKLRSGDKYLFLSAIGLRWEHLGFQSDIIAYRVPKEKPQTLSKPEAIDFNASGSKYLRDIQTIGGKVDVYAVLEAFAVTCPARQHAIKKLLCAGLRGKGDAVQDLREAADAVARAVQMEEARK